MTSFEMESVPYHAMKTGLENNFSSKVFHNQSLSHMKQQSEKKKSYFHKILRQWSNFRIKLRRWNLWDRISHSLFGEDYRLSSYANVLEKFSGFYEYKSWSTSSDRTLRRKNVILLFFATLGIVIMILSNILNFQWWYSITSLYSIYSGKARGVEVMPLRILCQVLKCLNVFITFIVLLSLISYYVTFASVKQKRWGYSNRVTAFFSSSLWKKFLLEFIVLSITPIPFIEWIFSRDVAESILFKLDIVMFARLYLFVRLIRDYSSSYQKRKLIIAQNNNYKKQLPEFGWQLSIKLLFLNYTVSVLIVLSVTTTLIASFCIWIAERDTGNKGLSSFYNTIYFTLVTEMTIGFGDIVPSRTFGRLTALMQGLLGILLISIFSGVVINKLTPTNQQKIAVEFLAREKALKKRLEVSVSILQVQWLYKKGKCSLNYKLNRVRANIKELHRLKKVLYKLNAKYSTDEILKKLVDQQQDLHYNIRNLTNVIQDIQMLAQVVLKKQASPNTLQYS